MLSVNRVFSVYRLVWEFESKDFYLLQKFSENPVKKEMERVWVVQAENLREQRNIWRGVEWMECSKRKFLSHFFKAIFDTSFRPSGPFFGKWN